MRIACGCALGGGVGTGRRRWPFGRTPFPFGVGSGFFVVRGTGSVFFGTSGLRTTPRCWIVLSLARSSPVGRRLSVIRNNSSRTASTLTDPPRAYFWTTL